MLSVYDVLSEQQRDLQAGFLHGNFLEAVAALRPDHAEKGADSARPDLVFLGIPPGIADGFPILFGGNAPVLQHPFQFFGGNFDSAHGGRSHLVELPNLFLERHFSDQPFDPVCHRFVLLSFVSL